MSIDPEDIRRKASIDRVLSKANVHRMRGAYLEAEDAYREALSIDESRVDVQELVADMIYARGQLDSALAAYKKVLEMEPSRASAETKYAKVALEIGEREYQKRLAQEMLENPRKSAPPARSWLLALIASALLPGSGQMYVGEYKKGAIILGAFLLSILVLALDPVSTGNLLKWFGALFNPTVSTGNLPIGGITICFVGMMGFLYIYAVIDGPASASKAEETRRKLTEPE